MINVLEKYYKQFTGGLPVPVKLIVDQHSLRFEVRGLTKMLSDQAQGFELLYSGIKSVEWEPSKFHTALSLGIIKAKVVLIQPDTVTFKLLDIPNSIPFTKAM